jgi:hypothetical protein
MRKIKDIIKQNIRWELYKLIKTIGLRILSIPFIFNLNKLARIYKTDKLGDHYYTQHYQAHFRKYKFRKIKLLEIGVGGHHYPNRGGCSLRMWKRYFPFGRIYSLDIYDKSLLEERRIKIFKGSQTDEVVLNKMIEQIGEPDIIIDDGSHINEHVIKTFSVLFPKLKDGGIYIIEDVGTSYWPDYGGDSRNLQNPSTIMNFFKSLTDRLNHQEFVLPNYVPGYFDKHIVSMQFYHNLIFIFKGANDEKSNIDWNNPQSIVPEEIIQ